MKELFIKCPSCRVILGVKNSKGETTKKIICPKCKQQLVVSFEEENKQQQTTVQPLATLYYGEMPIALQEGVNVTQFPGSDKVCLKVVHLADGGSKCVVQPLVSDGLVKINGEELNIDDAVVLSKGDKLQIEHVLLCYDQPYNLQVKDHNSENKESVKSKGTPDSPKRRKITTMLYAFVGLCAFAIVVLLLWPKQKDISRSGNKVADTAIVAVAKPVADSTKQKRTISDRRVAPPKQVKFPKQIDYESMNDYNLARYARKGDTRAQYVLGVRYVKRNGENNTILGLNYLKKASVNGSSEARTLFQECVNRLQQRVNANDSAAIYVLQQINK